jgi:competence protein ComEC
MENLRSFWNDLPAVRILMPFLLGLLFAIALLHFIFPPNLFIPFLSWMYALLCFLVFALIIVVWIGYKTKSFDLYYGKRYLWGAAIFFLLFFIGVLRLLTATELFEQEHYFHQSQPELFLVQVDKPPVKKAKTTFLICRFLEDSSGKKMGGLLNLMTPTDSISSLINYGDWLMVKGKPQWLEPAKNPYEFDYAQFQHFRNIYYRLYAKSGQIKIVSSNNGNVILSSVNQLRNYFLSIIHTHVKTQDERAVAGALMLGHRDDMSQEIVQAYASSGALHVMSVSGLHVGIVYLALQFLLSWMDRRKNLIVLKALILIGAMSLYAILTGLAPSVLRAVVMFSFFVVAKTIKRDANMYNILAVSCLALLVYNPYLITELGFKLSYLAVLGIVALYPILHKQWIVKNKVLAFIWSISCMSMAAQIATFPIGLYYFHQFPVLFIISNLIVIPVSNFIIYLGMLLFSVGEIAWLSKWLGIVFYYMIYYLNQIILLIEKAPFSLVEEIYISQTEMYLMYLLFGLVLLMYYKFKTKYLTTSLLIGICILAIRAERVVQTTRQESLTVYSIPKQKAISFVTGREATIDIDSSVLNNKSKMLFHVLHHWWAIRVNQKTPVDSIVEDSSFVKLPFGYAKKMIDKNVLVINNHFHKISSTSLLPQDIVILSGNKKINIKEVHQLFTPKEIIFDCSNKKWRVEKWKLDCDSLGIKYHDAKEYAYVREF